MCDKIFKLLVISTILLAQSNGEKTENKNQQKIDFWTNTIDEIFLRFRYNKLTHELEMTQGSSEEIKESSNKSHEKTKKAGENVKENNSTMGADTKLISFNVTDLKENLKNAFGVVTPTSEKKNPDKNFEALNKTVAIPISSISENLNKSKIPTKILNTNNKTLEKSVSSISENFDDSITAVKDDFIDFDLKKGLQSIDLSALKIKLPTQKGVVTGSHSEVVNNFSIDSCAYNCSNIPHIACGHSWSFSPKCSHNAKLINLENLQQLILDQHNKLRNNVAGNLTKFEPAVRMGTTQWHNELALYAQLNAMTCEDEHDFCHNTKDFKWSGQNLAAYYWSGRKKDLSTIITQMISNWYSENVNTEQSDLDKFNRVLGLKNGIISHFTNIVNERNTHIGCGAVAEKKGKFSTIYFTCNYARNNILSLPIYEKGPTASKCLTGVNPLYQNLCSVNEVYNYNV